MTEREIKIRITVEMSSEMQELLEKCKGRQEFRTAASPRMWGVAAEPGPEVKAVRDCDGDLWRRTNKGGWIRADEVGDVGADPAANWAHVMVWVPLTDATAEVTG